MKRTLLTLAILAVLGALAAPAVAAPPVAVADGYTTPNNTTLNVAAPGVLANDTDAEGDPLTAIYVSGPVVVGGPPVPGGAGALTLNADGSFTFTPNPNLTSGGSTRTVDFR